MERVRGRDLFEFFSEEQLATRKDRAIIVRELISQLLEAIAEIHDAGMVHKDLKMENVVCAEKPRTTVDERSPASDPLAAVLSLKLIDFDTMGFYDPGVKAFHVMGTNHYIAPECYAGDFTPAGDLWAIGVITFTMLTGRFPFSSRCFCDGPGENYVGHPAMERNRMRLQKSATRLDWSNPVWTDGPFGTAAASFVKSLLQISVQDRMTLEEAQAHEWILMINAGAQNP
jgi:serine/threonine protein kinase